MRISKVTTKAGDKGQTTLGDGTTVSKSHIRIECLGQIDELNATIGFVCTGCRDDKLVGILQSIQNDLLNFGGELSIPDSNEILLSDDRLVDIENNLKEMNSNLPPLVEFILPGGDDFSSRVHIARTVCRRVERKIVELLEVENRTERWIQYLNRLSDFLFVLARFYTHKHEVDESQWDRSK